MLREKTKWNHIICSSKNRGKRGTHKKEKTDQKTINPTISIISLNVKAQNS